MSINESTFNPIRTNSLLSEGIEQPLATGRSETTHAAGNVTSGSEVKRQGGPELPAPTQRLDGAKLEQARAVLNDTLDLMSQLFQLARLARQMGLTQRDMENQQVIDSQKAQVAEMRSGAKLMIVMAVVSGVMAGFSAITGGFSLSKSAKAIKQDKALNANIAGRQQELKQIGDIKKSAGLEMGDAGQELTARIKNDKATLKTLNKSFDANNSRQQIASTVIQSIGQMSNSAVQVAQGESQATAKEDEVKATISQTEKQKIEDNMAFNANFMKDVLQLMQQYSQTLNQTLKAAFGVA
ncbi:YopD family type III secretion system translocon subunit [Aeromonas jandaei]|uniref:YopD family type III secretion system translocon subunit n=1 Tax=Aeromonas TaxID=642 RepID=UPI0009030A90|nr:MULTISPECIES: YopD family type III secretion system translocon subunit [unclassified Aeromonas]QXC37532.1 YopD family type III secretion system translocon subunit [Aeromonas sp. FDAARGOS 1410]